MLRSVFQGCLRQGKIAKTGGQGMKKDFNNIHKLRSWRNTIDDLSAQTGMSLKDVCEYIGSAYNEDGVSFYVKLPRRRETYIGIGMAFRQTADVINSWITGYGGKRRLYAKDISEDLVWLYLINARLKDDTGEINYYRKYEDYQSAAYAVFRERWDEIVLGYVDTADVEISLGQAEFGPEYDGLRKYVAENMDAFKTAYAKPRSYLDRYVESILTTCRTHPTLNALRSLNSLRGYLDDSMINFLSGNSETINVIDKKTGKRTINIKHVPKGRRKYINLCLSLGMTCDDINKYLEMMGYSPLDIMDSEEGSLISKLTEWERNHPIQRAFKSRYIDGNTSVHLTEAEEHTAVEQMLQMKSEITE